MTKSNTRSKMRIESFSDPELRDHSGTFHVQVNPEKYSQSFEIRYDDTAAAGSTNTSIKFKSMPPSQLKFELLFDATGVLDDHHGDLDVEIEDFKRVVYDYDGSVHEPLYLRVNWGSLSFSARLTSLSLNYTLFRPDGRPLRARADVTFSSFESPSTICRKENKQSPDITHEYIVRAGDTLPALTNKAYGDPKYYLQIAHLNRLADFRALAEGTVLRFPPLD